MGTACCSPQVENEKSNEQILVANSNSDVFTRPVNIKSDSLVQREKEAHERDLLEKQESKVVVIQSYYRGKEGRKRI